MSGFPSADLVTAAAGLFPRLHGRSDATVTAFHAIGDGESFSEYRSDGEGPVWWLSIGPGIVRVRRNDQARRERSTAGDFDVRARAAAAAEEASAGFLVDELIPAGGGSVIRQWSRKSQSNLIRTIASLDLRALVDEGTPAMVTLTLPGDWLAVAPDHQTAAKAFHRWSAAYRKRYGTLRCIWKREFQRRGAPHWHLWMVPPADPEFRTWLSQSWTTALRPSRDHGDGEHQETVLDEDGRPDFQHSCKGSEWCRSLGAGTGIDYAEGERASDPKRLAVYFLKESLGGDGKAYQNRAPDEWDGAVGRFWGIKGLDVAIADVALAPEWAHRLFRSVRRVRAARRPLHRVRVIRGATRSGEPRYRWVTRRARIPAGAGWVAVNDGPAVGEALSRLAGDLAGLPPADPLHLYRAGAWDRFRDRAGILELDRDPVGVRHLDVLQDHL